MSLTYDQITMGGNTVLYWWAPKRSWSHFKRVLGKAREVTISDDTLCLLSLLQDVLW